jgi:hypothetical protein
MWRTIEKEPNYETKGFASTGIFPLKPDAISDYALLEKHHDILLNFEDDNISDIIANIDAIPGRAEAPEKDQYFVKDIVDILNRRPREQTPGLMSIFQSIFQK